MTCGPSQCTHLLVATTACKGRKLQYRFWTANLKSLSHSLHAVQKRLQQGTQSLCLFILFQILSLYFIFIQFNSLFSFYHFSSLPSSFLLFSSPLSFVFFSPILLGPRIKYICPGIPTNIKSLWWKYLLLVVIAMNGHLTKKKFT